MRPRYEKVNTPSCKPASEYHGAQLDMSISADACKNKLKRATSPSTAGPMLGPAPTKPQEQHSTAKLNIASTAQPNMGIMDGFDKMFFLTIEICFLTQFENNRKSVFFIFW